MATRNRQLDVTRDVNLALRRRGEATINDHEIYADFQLPFVEDLETAGVEPSLRVAGNHVTTSLARVRDKFGANFEVRVNDTVDQVRTFEDEARGPFVITSIESIMLGALRLRLRNG